MLTGWQKIDNEYYYLYTDGRMLTGWLNDNTGNRYYMSTSSGRMIRGWRQIDNSWYYFNSSGHMVKGWLRENGKYYYLDPSTGVMASDCSRVIDNVTYTFDQNGVCQNETNSMSGVTAAEPGTASSGSRDGNSRQRKFQKLEADLPEAADRLPLEIRKVQAAPGIPALRAVPQEAALLAAPELPMSGQFLRQQFLRSGFPVCICHITVLDDFSF